LENYSDKKCMLMLLRHLQFAISFVMRCVDCRGECGLCQVIKQDAGLDVLSARDILVGRVDCSDIALMLRLEELPYSKQVKGPLPILPIL
jgi:hypothetical protein